MLLESCNGDHEKANRGYERFVSDFANRLSKDWRYR